MIVMPTHPSAPPAAPKRGFMGIAASAYKRAKRGAIAGAVLGGVVAGYQGNVKNAYESSRAASENAAKLLREERDHRSTIEKFMGKALPAQIPVGKSTFTRRDSSGKIIEIGKSDVLKNAPGHMNWTPNIPASGTAVKYVGRGAAAGGIAGLFWPLLSRFFRRKKRNEQQ